MNVLALDTENNTWNKVPCKEWTGYKDKDGYGMKQRNGRPWGIHRLTWMDTYGELPPEVKVCHHCDNPSCYEITHLFIGTHKQNMEDMVKKGRASHHSKGGAKLTEDQVRAIREDFRQGKIIAQDYDVTPALISAIKLNKCWKDL